MSVQDRVKQIVQQSLAPVLKQDGFKKRGNVFRRAFDDGVQMVRVPTTGRSIDGSCVGSFSVELGLYFPPFLEIQGKTLPASQPGVGDLAFVAGLGATLDETRTRPPSRANWGFFDDFEGKQPDVARQAVALREDWEDYGRPWFDRYSQMDAARDYCASHNMQIEAFLFSLVLGDKDRARELLSECRQNWGGEWRDYVNRIASEHGIKV